ncbi:hypothetical protein CDAR_489851 [Caerostris darwini]|uniref:Uncharacterized protein n=1 Tax=Caerostris darwini TaxID=1538125 RepID=A0AAV4RJY8_9ARAC|nr:hypothetical protein CDAR_489851 [Caerostris darwini]
MAFRRSSLQGLTFIAVVPEGWQSVDRLQSVWKCSGPTMGRRMAEEEYLSTDICCEDAERKNCFRWTYEAVHFNGLNILTLRLLQAVIENNDTLSGTKSEMIHQASPSTEVVHRRGIIVTRPLMNDDSKLEDTGKNAPQNDLAMRERSRSA